MSNSIYAARKQYVDYVDDAPAFAEDEVVFDTTVYGVVVDDYDEMEVANGDTPEHPLANVIRAARIAEEIKSSKAMNTVREWYNAHRHDDDGFDYWMKED